MCYENPRISWRSKARRVKRSLFESQQTPQQIVVQIRRKTSFMEHSPISNEREKAPILQCQFVILMYKMEESASKACLGKHSAFPLCTDEGDRLFQLCADNRLFPSSTSPRHSFRRTSNRCSNFTKQVFKSDRPYRSKQPLGRFCSELAHTGRIEPCIRLNVIFTAAQWPLTQTLSVAQRPYQLSRNYRRKHETPTNSIAIDQQDQVKWAVRSAESQGPEPIAYQRYWIPHELLGLMEQK